MNEPRRPAPDELKPVTYPLRRRFVWVVLPAMILFMVVVAVLAGLGGRTLLTDFHLQQAAREAVSIVASVTRQAPGELRAAFARQPDPGTDLRGAIAAIGAVLDEAVADRRFRKVKVYDESGVLRYSTDREEIGTVERGEAINAALGGKGNVAALKETAEGPLYELYVYLPQAADAPAMVVELYESADILTGALRSVVIPATAAPLFILAITILFLGHMVFRAQRELDQQAAMAAGLQARLEKLVSGQAVSAARQVDGDGMKSRTIDVTLYFADVRDFTSFAEEHPPGQVIAMLNRIITLQVEAIHAAGGDVDKIIGDAVLAVFQGPDRALRAIRCAQDVLAACAAAPELPRGLGIGVHDGFVVAGVIGAQDRQDYTVIGDAVNVASRLCSLAARGELVADTRTLARAGHPDGFGATDELQVKGRAEPLRVRRWPASPGGTNLA